MAYLDYVTEIKGHIPDIDVLLVQKLVNRAWSDIRDEYGWSWLRFFGVFVAPQIVTAGTVTVNQFSNQVTLDSTAKAAVAGLTNPLITQRQIRIAQGPLYNISSYNPTNGVITLDRLYMEQNAVTQPYQIYRCYFQPADNNGNLITDWLTFDVVANPIEGYAIIGPNLHLTRKELDARDPTRGAQDVAYVVASFDVDSNGIPRYEFWPHPTVSRGYTFLGRRRGTDLSTTLDVPATFDKDLLVQRSLYHAYTWAIENAARFPSLKGVDWRLLQSESIRAYEKDIQKAKLKDDTIMLDSFLPQLRDYLQFPPLDAKFAQSHDMGDWFSGDF
jgi:hypothetical protein